MLIRLLKSNFIVSLVLFFTAFIPRVLDLGRFLTADEFLWVDRSKNFLAGLLNEAYQCDSVVEQWNFVAEGLACTLRTGHPGVTTMWIGAFGFWLSWLPVGRSISLYDYVVAASTNPLDAGLIVPERLGTVLIVSIWVVAVYHLTRRLFGPWLALTGALLIALDPFHIALSRVIHHDALSTTFMTLSALTALIYWGQRESRPWLIFSGVFAGLGFLSKSPALYLMPFVAIVGLWFGVITVRRPQSLGALLTKTITEGLVWFAAAVVTVWLVWPAMWAVPLQALETVFLIGSKYATGGHAKGNFFMGVISNDPGPLFYPVSWLFRTTPPVLLGLVVAFAVWPWLGRRRSAAADSAQAEGLGSFYRFLPLILIFIAGYALFMTLGEKKQERYFLPVYPWLDLIAGAGLVALFDLLLRPVKMFAGRIARPGHGALVALVLIVPLNGYLIFQSFPYYFTYYNPLLGGITTAAQVLTIGWGEGLDQAADFLNRQVRSPDTRVASWYESTFAPFYRGRSISYSKEKGKALAGDYVIFYINQTQRRFPDDAFFDYFENRFQPVEIITLQGLDYAWIYPSLGVDHYVDDQTYTGIASLLAWQWAPDTLEVQPGQTLKFELYWEYLGKREDEPFFVRVVDAQQRIWAEGRSETSEADHAPDQWQEGEIVLDRGRLSLPDDLPPGQYGLQIGFYTNAPAVEAGELLFELPPLDAGLDVQSKPRDPWPVRQTSPDFSPQPLAETLTLLNATLPPGPLASGQTFDLELLWQVERPLPAGTALHIGLLAEAGEARQAWFNLTLAEILNPTAVTWQPGDILRTRWSLDLLPDLPSGRYRLELVWPDDPSQTISIGEIEVGGE